MADGLETFAKVRALHDSTTHAGEKANCAATMEKLARKAGLTVDQAKSKLDAQKRTASRSHRSGRTQASDKWRQRQEEARRQAEAAKAEARRQAEEAKAEAKRWRAAEALRKYGSREAVFARCAWEQALYEACEPIAVRETWYDPAYPERASLLDGWWNYYSVKDMPESVRAAVQAAYPMPQLLRDAWEEARYWTERMRARWEFDDDFDTPAAIQARLLLVSAYLYEWPAANLKEAVLRCEWFKADREASDFYYTQCEEVYFADIVRRDLLEIGFAHEKACKSGAVQSGHCQPVAEKEFADLHAHEDRLESQPVQTGHRPTTRAERRAAAAALIAEGLSDREVARRLGISPTTVGTIRRRADSSC
jgi:Homeodomain-like domain